MKREETESKVSVITEAVGHTFEGFDFVVDALDHGGGDGLVVEGENAVGVGGYGACEFDEFRDAGS